MSILPCKYSEVGKGNESRAQHGVNWKGLRAEVHCDLRSSNGKEGRREVRDRAHENNKKWEGLLTQGGKSQACVNNTRGDAVEVPFSGGLCGGGELSWQVFDAELITVEGQGFSLVFGKGTRLLVKPSKWQII